MASGSFHDSFTGVSNEIEAFYSVLRDAEGFQGVSGDFRTFKQTSGLFQTSFRGIWESLGFNVLQRSFKKSSERFHSVSMCSEAFMASLKFQKGSEECL